MKLFALPPSLLAPASAACRCSPPARARRTARPGQPASAPCADSGPRRPRRPPDGAPNADAARRSFLRPRPEEVIGRAPGARSHRRLHPAAAHRPRQPAPEEPHRRQPPGPRHARPRHPRASPWTTARPRPTSSWASAVKLLWAGPSRSRSLRPPPGSTSTTRPSPQAAALQWLDPRAGRQPPSLPLHPVAGDPRPHLGPLPGLPGRAHDLRGHDPRAARADGRDERREPDRRRAPTASTASRCRSRIPLLPAGPGRGRPGLPAPGAEQRRLRAAHGRRARRLGARRHAEDDRRRREALRPLPMGAVRPPHPARLAIPSAAWRTRG